MPLRDKKTLVQGTPNGDRRLESPRAQADPTVSGGSPRRPIGQYQYRSEAESIAVDTCVVLVQEARRIGDAHDECVVAPRHASGLEDDERNVAGVGGWNDGRLDPGDDITRLGVFDA